MHFYFASFAIDPNFNARGYDGILFRPAGQSDTYFRRDLLPPSEPIKVFGGSFQYGHGEPHCYVGEIPAGQNIEMHYMPIFAEHMRMMAPGGADTESWLP